MLQGFANKTGESGAELWKLSRQALESPAMAENIRATPVRRLAAELRRTDEGREFMEAFGAYLDEYGWRSGAFELADPSWREEPAVPLGILREYLHQPDEHDPLRLEAKAAAERDRVVTDTLTRLHGHPQ